MNTHPNILLIFPDQHRGDWMPYPPQVLEKLGMKALELHLPNIERLMVQGVTFHECITPAPVCAPARACLATGLKYSFSRCINNGENTPLDQATFFQVLRDGGYHVGGVGKFDLQKADREFGLDGWIPKHEMYGFDQPYTCDNAGKNAACKVATTDFYSWKNGRRVSRKIKDPDRYRAADPYLKYLEDKGLMHLHIKEQRERSGPLAMFNTSPVSLKDEDYFDNFVGNNALKMLDAFPRDGTPWFLWVNFVGPHDPFDVTERMKDSIEDRYIPAPVQGNSELEDGVVDIRRNYAAAIENIDRNIGLMFEKLEERGELDNTLIIYASDHGEMLGDFSRWHKSVPFRGATRVPLIISGPGIARGKTSDALVEMQDLTATIIEFAGLSMPSARQSISLKPVLEDPVSNSQYHRTFQTSALVPNPATAWSLISDGKFKLILSRDSTATLIDLNQDPWEEHDISSEKPEKVEELRNLLNDTYKGSKFWDLLPK
ncbi:sulfatase-like hydrolase/transferase [Candidatus Bathyarchaeota archaeon]|nr:sulfatase-like hydrolase/transferase [Candidatus Bathyarchaeota archaeon]